MRGGVDGNRTFETALGVEAVEGCYSKWRLSGSTCKEFSHQRHQEAWNWMFTETGTSLPKTG